MPIYEYQCKTCGVRFERVQRFSDDPVKICPECGGEVYRLLQPVGIIFKGSGFYVTDHRSSSSTSSPGKKSFKSESSEKSGSSEGED
ncbi:MAG: FmdB family zinc ribbon protein [Anaerolineae bacterium]|nr:zinc ribbon domain-containing protein [Anaerolineae bacterium]MCX8066885.1 zinc ribbon domain-containing protein [Anaerolineae bacterium]MDW7991963.1 FmdB family zinc ribbon protein [Anaerolineae bacterium]